MIPFINVLPTLCPKRKVDYCRQVLTTWSQKGCTTVFDAGVGTVDPQTDMTTIGEAKTTTQDYSCPVRFLGAITPTVATSLKLQHPPYRTGGATLASIRFWADGSTQGFNGAVREKYLGKQGYGALNWSDWQLRSQMAPWHKLGWQLLVHSNDDRATDQTLAAYDSILNELPEGADKPILHRIEHFTVTKPEQLVEARRLGLAVSHTIGHVYCWGKTFENFVLGAPRAAQIDPVRDDINNGLVYTFHSDSPVTDVNPLLYARTAVSRPMYKTDTPLGTEQCVTLEEALRGITYNAAKQVLMGDKIGSLEEGKFADLVILDKDPRTVSHETIHERVVEETWLQGRQMYIRSKI